MRQDRNASCLQCINKGKFFGLCFQCMFVSLTHVYAARPFCQINLFKGSNECYMFMSFRCAFMHGKSLEKQ